MYIFHDDGCYPRIAYTIASLSYRRNCSNRTSRRIVHTSQWLSRARRRQHLRMDHTPNTPHCPIPAACLDGWCSGGRGLAWCGGLAWSGGLAWFGERAWAICVCVFFVWRFSVIWFFHMFVHRGLSLRSKNLKVPPSRAMIVCGLPAAYARDHTHTKRNAVQENVHRIGWPGRVAGSSVWLIF